MTSDRRSELHGGTASNQSALPGKPRCLAGEGIADQGKVQSPIHLRRLQPDQQHQLRRSRERSHAECGLQSLPGRKPRTITCKLPGRRVTEQRKLLCLPLRPRNRDPHNWQPTSDPDVAAIRFLTKGGGQLTGRSPISGRPFYCLSKKMSFPMRLYLRPTAP